MKHDWIQIVSTLAVVAGLMMVIAELRQSHDQAQAQLMLDDFISLHEHQYTLMGSDPAEAIVKARTSPEQLTDAEKMIVDAHLRVEYERLAAYEYIYGVTDLFDEDWETVVPVAIEEFYFYPYAREWISNHQQRGQDWNPRLEQIVNEYLALNPLD